MFQGLTAQTDDDGKKYAIQIRRDGATLAVERNVRPDVLSPSTFDRGIQRDGTVPTTLPPQLLPSTHWNSRQVRQSALVNTQTGTQACVRVSVLGRETIRTANTSIDATRSLEAETHGRRPIDLRLAPSLVSVFVERHHHCPARDDHPMASNGVPTVLALEGALSWRSTKGSCGDPAPDPGDEPGKPAGAHRASTANC